MNAPNSRIKELLAKMNAAKQEIKTNHWPHPETSPGPEFSSKSLESSKLTTTDKYGRTITYNSQQQKFIDLVSRGKSAVLIGAAGTGKTTCQKGSVQRLIDSGIAGILDAGDHKHLKSGTPGIAVCAYTRRAVANIRRNLSTDMQSSCLTIHKLLEYEPVYYEVTNEKGEVKNTMKFEPRRTIHNPLPQSLRVIIFEEASMIGTDLHQQVIDACPHNPICIYIGDIQQLAPVFGPAILGFKLLELPVVELTEVYRQALESPIIRLAHRILSGNPIPQTELPDWKYPDQLTLHPWKKKIEDIAALSTASLFFRQLYDKGGYDPEVDMILLPFNKSFGTIELNKEIANHLARKREAETHEIIAGFQKHYFSVGDKVLYDKEDAIILRIDPNPAYAGAQYQHASKTLDYHGYNSKPTSEDILDDVDFMLAQVANKSGDSEDRVNQASHIVTLQMVDMDAEVRISKAGDINALLLGYCLTVHKSQGSEWRKVFFVMHQSHATMVQRELLYTGVTRAREELYVICEPETFHKGILSQRIKGNTLEEKAEFFKGKKERMELEN